MHFGLQMLTNFKALEVENPRLGKVQVLGLGFQLERAWVVFLDGMFGSTLWSFRISFTCRSAIAAAACQFSI